MKTQDIHGLGMVFIMVAGAIFYVTDGNPILHYSTIVYLATFIGLALVNKAYDDAKRGKDEW